jgi:hypothetical protein
VLSGRCGEPEDFRNLGTGPSGADRIGLRIPEAPALKPSAFVMTIGPFDLAHLKGPPPASAAALESMAGAGIVPTIPELGGAPAWQPGAVMRSRRVRTALAAGDHHRRTGAEPGVAGDRLQAVLIVAFGALEPDPAPGTIGITLHFGALCCMSS